jgi:hypothetical protein
MNDLILVLLHTVTNTHILHWQTRSYAEHVALGDFYDGLSDLTDKLMEACMGLDSSIPSFPDEYIPPAESGLQELLAIQEYFEQERHVLPNKSEIQNIADEIAGLIDVTVYKLRRFD